jgi:dual specificity tyrosine-phosphorylation-regulated kinase 2/3/4
MKIIKNKKKYYCQAGVELKILQFLKDNDPEDIMNVIHLNDYVIFRKHLCIGFELMSMNLFEFLKINDFNVSIFRFFICCYLFLFRDSTTI